MDNSSIVLGIVWAIRVITYLLIARALVSWFPNWRNHEIVQLLFDITDPLLEPVRKLLPPRGGLDFSIMLTVIALIVLSEFVRTLA